MARVHPCLTCGACCGIFRVSFYWAETDDVTPGGVPLELTEESPPFRRTMKGTTDRKHVRCVALEGRIGERASCTIYSSRSSTCRSFEASYENGRQNKRCDDARAKFGMKPLKPGDCDGGDDDGEDPNRPPTPTRPPRLPSAA